MSQANWKNLCIHLDLIAEESWSPVDVLRSQHNWFLINPMLQDGHVDWLV